MRWDALFNDMESQLAESEQLALESEISERTRAEFVEMDLVGRLRGALGYQVTVFLACGESFRGTLSYAGAEALVLEENQHQVLIPHAAAVRYAGLGRLSLDEGSSVRRSLGLAHSLRALARDRSELSIILTTSSGAVRVEGVIDRVGKDYVDVAAVVPGEPRRASHVTQVSTVPFAALAAVRSRRSDGL